MSGGGRLSRPKRQAGQAAGLVDRDELRHGVVSVSPAVVKWVRRAGHPIGRVGYVDRVAPRLVVQVGHDRVHQVVGRRDQIGYRHVEGPLARSG